jgi:hypothetical protein
MALLKNLIPPFTQLLENNISSVSQNLIIIMKQEAKYFGLIELINSGCEVNSSSKSGNTTPGPFESGNSSPNPFYSGNTTPNPFG